MGVQKLIDDGIITKEDIIKFYEKIYGNGTSILKPAIWSGGTINDDSRIKRVYADVTNKDVTINETNYKGINLQERFKDKNFTETFRETVIYEEKTGTIDTKKKQSVIEIIYIAN